MLLRRLKEFLDQHNVRYTVIEHSTAYTALEVAEAAHIPGKEIAKTVIIKLAQNTAMLVLPASRRVSLSILGDLMGVADVRLATEEEFQSLFPGCQIGAMPPLGNLFSMDVYVDSKLAKDEDIAFNAGNHHQLIRMKYKDFERLVRPAVIDFTVAATRR